VTLLLLSCLTLQQATLAIASQDLGAQALFEQGFYTGYPCGDAQRPQHHSDYYFFNIAHGN
jgi:hypothetical protein